MTQAAEQRRQHPRLLVSERRIIERPRLMRRLDGSGARTILLLAPAGFGKTTLARQWRATLCRSVLLALTPAHRDVTVIARDLARSIESAGVEGFQEFMEQYIRARSSPQAEAASLGRALADGLERAQTGWLVVDDYHDVADTPEAEELMETLLSRTGARFLVCSRVRPRWATARRQLYGELDELDQRMLAMDQAEAEETLGRSNRAARELIALADGWPAVLALAAPLDVDPPATAAPEALHRYLAEEFLGALSQEAQLRLTDLALLPEAGLQLDGLPSWDVGLLLVMLDVDGSIHRLLREFLLTKADQAPDREQRLERAVTFALEKQSWERAFELIERFHLDHRIEEAAEGAFEALVDSGQIWTLAHFVSKVANRADPGSGIVALVEAEAALAEGRHPEFRLELARSAERKLASNSRFSSRAAYLTGEALFTQGDMDGSREAFSRAAATASTEDEVSCALFGALQSAVLDEASDAEQAIGSLRSRRDVSAANRLGYAAVEMIHLARRGPVRITPAVQEALEARPRVTELRRLASVFHMAACYTGLRGEYRAAEALHQRSVDLIDLLDLRFARPHALYDSALIKLGLRRIGEATRELNLLAKEVEANNVLFHDLNHRVLRARLLLSTCRTSEALDYVEGRPRDTCVRPMRAEYYSTQAMVLAALGDYARYEISAEQASALSNAPEVRAQLAAAKALAAATRGDIDGVIDAFMTGSSVDAWDPFICALRGHGPLVEIVRDIATLRPLSAEMCRRAEDIQLARRLGVKVPHPHRPEEVLTRRELEILDLLAQGLRNADIARSLFISQATVKVHIRHIFEKLDVRTRAQAVSQLS